MTYNFTDKQQNTIAISTFKGVQIASTKNTAYIKRNGVYFSFDKTLNTDDIKIACEHMLNSGANLLPARISQNNGATTSKTIRHTSSDYTADEITRDLFEHIKRAISKIDDSNKVVTILKNVACLNSVFELNVTLDAYNERAERAEAERAEAERREREQKAQEKQDKQNTSAIRALAIAMHCTIEQATAMFTAMQAQPQAQPQAQA